jgi:hypothetical protein
MDIDEIARRVWEEHRAKHLDRGIVLGRWDQDPEALRQDWRDIVRWTMDAAKALA